MSRRHKSESTSRRLPREESLLGFQHWRKEQAIRRALRGLARQRVAAILQPGNMLVVERGPSRREPSQAALRSCHLRGWAEPIANAVRSGTVGPDGTLPEGNVYDSVVPIYRITDAGWNVLYRTQAWVVMTFIVALASLVATLLGITIAGFTGDHTTPEVVNRAEGRIRSWDGVEIAYSDRGSGGTALLFIHGGLADRSFWSPQILALSGRFRVVAPDLAGHGESGRNRTEWTIPAFAQDVRAVVEALDLKRTVLIGNSLGGPVALEAARLLPGRTIGVVGVDTLHDATARQDPAEFAARAEAFRSDFGGACRSLVESLFHPGTQRDLRAWAERRMCAMPPGIVASMMEGFGGYDVAAAFRGAGVPIRAINGDLWPTHTDLNRKVAPDFDAVVMSGAGHYPMLERPAEFNRILIAIVDGLESAAR